MRTIVSGAVDEELLEIAEMFSIEPSIFVSNGLSYPPVDEFMVPTKVYPLCPKLPKDTAITARDYTLVQNADALIMKGRDQHLLDLAHEYGLLVCQED